MSKESIGEFHIEVKRFRVPFKFNLMCPTCGHIKEEDLEVRYLCYPTANKAYETFGYCMECGEDIPYNLTLKVDVDVNGDCVVDNE